MRATRQRTDSRARPERPGLYYLRRRSGAGPGDTCLAVVDWDAGGVLAARLVRGGVFPLDDPALAGAEWVGPLHRVGWA